MSIKMHTVHVLMFIYVMKCLNDCNHSLNTIRKTGPS